MGPGYPLNQRSDLKFCVRKALGVPTSVQNFIKIGSVVDEYDRETELNRKIQTGGGPNLLLCDPKQI